METGDLVNPTTGTVLILQVVRPLLGVGRAVSVTSSRRTVVELAGS